MNDGFDKKREVVQHLLGMLKGNAVNEMESSNKPKMGHKADCMDKMCSGGCAMKMSDGGMAMSSDEPENVMASELPAEGGASHESPAMGEMEEEDEDNHQSSFMGLMKRKK